MQIPLIVVSTLKTTTARLFPPDPKVKHWITMKTHRRWDRTSARTYYTIYYTYSHSLLFVRYSSCVFVEVASVPETVATGVSPKHPTLSPCLSVANYFSHISPIGLLLLPGGTDSHVEVINTFIWNDKFMQRMLISAAKIKASTFLFKTFLRLLRASTSCTKATTISRKPCN